jgi:peptidylprolyl isomerase domain and WD repeat-containing protein 1
MILSADESGCVKFWKRTGDQANIEFVKSYAAHVGPATGACISKGSTGGSMAATVGRGDSTIKFYDVTSFDVIGLIKTGKPKNSLGSACCFILRTQTALAVASAVTGEIFIYDSLTTSPTPSKVISIHPSPVTSMAFESTSGIVISGDQKGMLEYWDALGGVTGGGDAKEVGGAVNSSQHGIEWTSKFDTDLYALAKKGVGVVAIATSSTRAAVYGGDRRIRIFDFKTAKVVVKYDESSKAYDADLAAGRLEIDSIEYGKRAALEREINDSPIIDSQSTLDTGLQRINIEFDDSGRLLLYPTAIGVKVVDVESHRVVRIIGSGDAGQNRFLNFCVCDVDSKVDKQMALARTGQTGKAIDHSDAAKADLLDPMIVGVSYKKRRIYCFSKYDDVEGDEDGQAAISRDVLNEAPDADDLMAANTVTLSAAAGKGKQALGKEAILRTTMGDIHFTLYGTQCPRTVENFCGHSRSGYYDNVLFHRVIKGFMLQTGDPLGDGTGGESIWGGEFEDEFDRSLRHDRPFTVSMANAGEGTNGSQFFITTVPTPWLDNKHSVFGRVNKGMDVCAAIEQAATDHLDKPSADIKILSVDIL